MVAGLWVFLQRNGLSGVTWASVAAGTVGGIGFVLATLFKLMEIKTGWTTNWHSVLEQTYGLINGLGIGAVMWVLARRAPRLTGDAMEQEQVPGADTTAPIRNPKSEIRNGKSSVFWPEIVSLLCLLALIPWLNLRQNSAEWVKQKAIPEGLYRLSTATWYIIGWAAFTLMLFVILLAARRRTIAAIPTSWLGRAQWLYLIFLWIFAIGNFEKALTGFREQRLITEGVILLNAMLCTVLALLWPVDGRRQTTDGHPNAVTPVGRNSPFPNITRTVAMGGAAASLAILLGWGLVRAVWGDTFAGYAGKHIRFGPNATAYSKPKSGQPHP
jgi:hypothetical protein